MLVTRESTERSEGVEAGTLTLVGTDSARIVSEASRLLDDPAERTRRADLANPYGDGAASARIVQALDQVFHDGPPVQIAEAGNQLRQAVRRRLGIAGEG